MTKITCISPVDGSVYAEREVDSRRDIDEMLTAARAAQIQWAKQSIFSRSEIVTRAMVALEAMNDEIVPQLAWQMGRPVRYGGEMAGVKERSAYMSEIAEKGLAPVMVEDSDRFKRYIAREPLGLMLVIAPWNYPYMTAINGIVPGFIAI